MAVVAFPARNKLAYPAGRAPGLDPTHPASDKCYFSAVPGGGQNYVNLVTYIPCVNTAATQTTALTPSITGALGPGIAFPSDTCPVPGVDMVGASANLTAGAATFAAIFRCPTANANFSELSGTRQSNDSVSAALYLNNLNELIVAFPASVHSGLTPTVGHHYFAAASTPAVSGQPIFFVLKNLTTGQVVTSSVVQNQSTTFAFRYVFVGNDKGGASCQAPIAAAMFAETVLNQFQLLQWADDPWAFWYPPQAGMQIATSGVTPPVTTVLYQLMNVG